MKPLKDSQEKALKAPRKARAPKEETNGAPKPPDPRQLKDLISVNAAALRDLASLGIKTVEELAKCDAKKLFSQLCRLTHDRHDICSQDVFSAAIAQAKNPKLSAEKCDWWYWNHQRKKDKTKTF